MSNSENTTQFESKDTIVLTDLSMISSVIEFKRKFIEVFDPTSDIERTLDILGKLHSETTPGIRKVDDFSAVTDGYYIEAEQLPEHEEHEEDGGENIVVGVYNKMEDAVFSDFAHTVTPAMIKLVKAIIAENKELKRENKKISMELENMKFAAKYCSELSKSRVEAENRMKKVFNNKAPEIK